MRLPAIGSLLIQSFRSRVPVGIEDQRQIAHCQVACSNLGDERETMSILEVAIGDHIPIEAWGHSRRKVCVVCACSDRRTYEWINRWRGRSIEVEATRAGLRSGTEDIGSCIR